MSGIGYQVFGFAASVVSTLFLTQVVYGWLQDAMPSAKMRGLDAVLSETEALLRSALEEGTIDYGHYDLYLRSRLWAIKLCADEYRAQVYTIKSRWHELVHWLGGLSSNIAAVIDDLCDLRGQVAVSSSRGRQRLERLGRMTNPTLEKYARRDIPSEPPAHVTCPPLDACTVGEISAVLHDTATLSPQPIPCVSPFSDLHPSSWLLTAGKPVCAPPAGPEVHSLPPLAFRSKEKVPFAARRVERAVLHCGKHSSLIDGGHSRGKERRGLASPLRVFSSLFHHFSTAALPATTTCPSVSTPLAPSEKRLHTAQWEENGHLVFRVTLPA